MQVIQQDRKEKMIKSLKKQKLLEMTTTNFGKLKLNIVKPYEHLKPKCPSCQSDTCLTLRNKLVDGYIMGTCRNNKTPVVIGSVSYDENIVETLGHNFLQSKVKYVDKYITCLELDFINFMKDTMFPVIKSYGNYLYIYNGTTKLWEKCNVEHGSYVVSHLSILIMKYFKEDIQIRLASNLIEDREQATITLKKIGAFCIQCKKKSLAMNAVKTITSGAKIFPEVDPDLLAGVTYLFPVQGGNVINLKDGFIFPREKEHFFTHESSLLYLGHDFDCSHMYKFLFSILGSEEKVRSMQEHLGYCLTGDTSLNGLNILTGIGGNGKSVLLDLMSKVLGDFYTPLMADALTGTVSSGASPELMCFIGKRMAGLSETDANVNIKEARVKNLTGGDEYTSARPLYGKPVDFKNKAKLYILTNEPPNFNPSPAMRRRIKLFHLKMNFVFKHQYNMLKDKTNYKIRDDDFCRSLSTVHLNEVFTFLVNGAMRYYKNKNLFMAEEFEKDTYEYCNDNDHINNFVNEKCLMDPNYTIGAKNLMDLYNLWAHGQRLEKLSARSMKSKMMANGFVHRRIGGRSKYIGLKYNHKENVDTFIDDKCDLIKEASVDVGYFLNEFNLWVNNSKFDIVLTLKRKEFEEILKQEYDIVDNKIMGIQCNSDIVCI